MPRSVQLPVFTDSKARPAEAACAATQAEALEGYDAELELARTLVLDLGRTTPWALAILAAQQRRSGQAA